MPPVPHLHQLLRRLRASLPDRVRGVASNCGGTNWNESRFAGHLLDADLSEEQFVAISHALIFRNGVRRSTFRGRNAMDVRRLLDEGDLPFGPRLRVLDVGPSGGLDSLATLEVLRTRFDVTEYFLGDLFTHVLYDRERGLIFDEYGKLLQVRRRHSFVATGFEYNFPVQRVTSLPKRLRPWLLEKRCQFDRSRSLEHVPLVHPELRVGQAGSVFKSLRMNVFESIEGSFDLVICMHLLVPRYFTPEQIASGITNLSNALAPGGTLIVGATEHFRIVQRGADGMLRSRERRSTGDVV